MLKVIASHILISDDLETRKVWCTQYAVQFNFIKISLVCDSIELFRFKGKCFTMVDEEREKLLCPQWIQLRAVRETLLFYMGHDFHAFSIFSNSKTFLQTTE